MVDTVTKAERKVAKALAAFRGAHDTIAAAEAELDNEAALVDEQIASLASYRRSVEISKTNAAQVRTKLAEFIL